MFEVCDCAMFVCFEVCDGVMGRNDENLFYYWVLLYSSLYLGGITFLLTLQYWSWISSTLDLHLRRTMGISE